MRFCRGGRIEWNASCIGHACDAVEARGDDQCIAHRVATHRVLRCRAGVREFVVAPPDARFDYAVELRAVTQSRFETRICDGSNIDAVGWLAALTEQQ